MSKLTDYTSYADAQKHFSPDKLWELFDGDRDRINIAHECIDRHVEGDADRGDPGARRRPRRDALVRRDLAPVVAIRALPGRAGRAGGRPRRRHARAVARLLRRDVRGDQGWAPSPCRCSRCSVRTASGCACATARRRSCSPTPRRRRWPKASPGTRVVVADDALMDELVRLPGAHSRTTTRGDDYAIYQYTSGTTRELPEAVKHSHRAIVTLMLAALYGTGLRPGDRFFCPSSPAWGHGLWHGTLAPLALGLTIGAFSGKFNAERLLKALRDHRFTNLSAAATHYRMMRNCGAAPNYDILPREAVVHRRAHRQRDGHLRRADVRTPGVQHVRHHRDRRDPGELPGRARFPGEAGLARQADSRRQGRGAGRQRRALPARRHRRAEGLAPRRLGAHQGSRPRRRRRLLLSRRTRRRRHHLRRLDHERGRDRGRDPQAPAGAGSRRHRRPRCAARTGRQGVRRRPPRRRRDAGQGNPGPRAQRPQCARVSAARRLRRRAAQDAGRQGAPQGAARPRAGRPRRRADAPSQLSPSH